MIIAEATSAPAVRASGLAQIIREPILWLVLSILVLGALTSPHYLSALNIQNLLRNAALVGLLATGMTIVLITGRIDLSVAANMVFSVIVAVVVTSWVGRELGLRWIVKGNTFAGSPLIFVAVSLLTGTAIGALNGVGVAYFKVASFIMTLVSLTALRGLSYLATNGAPFYLKGAFFNWLSDELWLGVPVSFVLLVVLVLFAHAFLSRTVAGNRLFAIGGNETATLYSGITTNRYIVASFALSGLFAAVAGLVFTARLKSVEAALAQGYELTAIAIAVLGGVALAGGTGSLWRVLTAAVGFSAGLNLLAIWGVPTWYQNLAIGAVLILAVSLTRLNHKN
ncbi:ABC transporter permease [Sinorhizobium mexicanum]|uniref:ABC transporter permease n=1 Tax=Sinorhizobium mexicanum TaxID=375549 RepID=UPI0015DEED36|nr:ABC transporter permease [Sinorhizobium mexicanum]MBP1886699.1 ribose/xylose/arabinose/galactoside ABC-type transport system permease subunit [Sinorhizobium mexicanum]